MKKTLIEPTAYIKNIFADNSINSEDEIIFFILKYLKNLNLPERHDSKEPIFRQRTAEQILKDGFVTGCTDDAIVFIAAARSYGLKPIYIEALEKDWMEKPMEEKMVRGHAFVAINDLFIDPQRKAIYIDANWAKSRYVVYAEGNEPYDFGLTDFKTTMKKFMEFKGKYQKEKIKH